MKIEYQDGSYLEIKDFNNKIQISISATDANNKKKLIVNSAIISHEQMIELMEKFSYIKKEK